MPEKVRFGSEKVKKQKVKGILRPKLKGFGLFYANHLESSYNLKYVNPKTQNRQQRSFTFELEKLDGKTKFKFYFDDGTLEGPEDSRKVVEILKGKGFDITYLEGKAGHNWTAWRDRLADAFIAWWR